MSGFKVTDFGGVIPKLGSRLLPNNGAQVAQNVKLFSGELRSWLRASVVNTPSKGGNLLSMYRMYATSTTYTTATGDYWLSWPSDVDVVKSQIAGDTRFKLYFTGDTTTATNSVAGPRKTDLALATVGGTDYPHDWLEIGVPAPGSAPAIVGTGGTSTVSVSRVYIYTYVTSTSSWAEEGPPSPTGTGTGRSDATWVISSLSTGTTGKYAFGGAIKRIYRTLTDNSGNTNYQLALDSVPIATTSTNDTVVDGSLGVICPSFINGVVGSEWVSPPSDLQGIVALPNGIFAGFSGNSICFSEPFYPHAWPIRYRLATNFDIVSLGVYGQTLIVTTKGYPYAVTGIRPDSMAMARIEQVQPCVSKRSTVSFPYGVAWATPDGLALAGVGGAINSIEPFMKRDEWQAQCFPSTLIARQYLDTYFGFFQTGTSGANFVFDKTNTQGPLTFGNYDISGVWSDPETAKMYILQNGNILQWDSDALNNSPFDWRSKTFVTPKPINFGAIQVDADYGSIFGDFAASTAAAAADRAVNAAILGTGQSDTALLTVWSTGSIYSTGDVRKSTDGVKMIICTVAGTSSTLEPTYPSTLGGTATDGVVRWKRIWDLQGVTKGEVRGQLTRGYIQQSTGDPFGNDLLGNRWGFPLRGSLMVGGVYANYDNRSLLLQVYAVTNPTTSSGMDTSLVSSQYLTSRESVRLPRGFKSDTWEFRLTGNINVRYFKCAETMEEIGKIV